MADSSTTSHPRPSADDNRQTKRARHEIDYSTKGFGTVAIHAGQAPDPVTGAVCTPISLATTFAQRTPGEATYEYSRTGNPTRHALEACFAATEKAAHGLAFASGSAVTAAVIALLSPGDHVVSMDDVYGGTNRYFQRLAGPSQGKTFSFVDMTQIANLTAALTAKTKLVWIESPTNPTLKIVDLEAAIKAIRAYDPKILIVVDNTFATPYLQSPIKLGADFVVHSATKYINGHSDIVMGLIATNSEELRARLAFVQNGVGAVPSPFDCFMVMRGMKTLEIRMERHCENAMRVAEYLSRHPKVDKVIYPGLPSHPQHEVATRQMRRFGGMITFFIHGGEKAARQFLESLELVTLAESLGAVESLVEYPLIMTHASVPPEARAKLGISDALIRMSVGIELCDDIVSDLRQAFDKVDV